MASAAAPRKQQQTLLGSLALGELAEHLGVVPERHVDLGQSGLDVGDHRAQVPALDVGADVDAPGATLALDLVRRRLDRDVRDVAEAAPGRPSGVSIGSSRTLVRLCRVSGVDHTTTSYALPVSEDVTDLLAGERGRGRPTHVARLEAVALRPGEVDHDLRPGGSRPASSTCSSIDPVDPPEDVQHLLGGGPQRRRGPRRRSGRRSPR